MLKPKLFSILKHGKRELTQGQLMKEIISGIIVAVIALPLSVALGIASGVTPEKGLITAIIAGFLISFLGGSRVQIGGPTGAFVVIVYGIVEKFGVEGLIISTMMAGLMLILMGVLKFGNLIKFIPCTITTGFTTGIAVVLFSTQIKDFLGLKIDKVPSEFIEKWSTYIEHSSTIQLETLIIGVLSLLVIIYWPRVNKTIPGSLVALVAATLLVKLLNLPVETIGDRFGQLSSSIPVPKFTLVKADTIMKLIRPSVTIALLAGIESLLSAVVADRMIEKKHNSNMELVAQGVANIASAAFGGIPATGAIARTAANVKNGARTPISGVVHAITLLVIMVTLMPLANIIPMTALAAILIMVSYNMSDFKEFKTLLRAPKSDIAVLLITFLLTVVFDLVIAIEAGMLVAMILFVKRMAESTKVQSIGKANRTAGSLKDGEQQVEASDNGRLLIYEVSGPLFFGAAQSFDEIKNEIKASTEILIFKMSNVPVIDATAYDSLKRIYEECEKRDIELMFSEIQMQPTRVMQNMGFVDFLGRDKIFISHDAAVEAATEMLTNEEEQTA